MHEPDRSSRSQSHRNGDQLAAEMEEERRNDRSYEEFAAPRHELSLFQAYRETDTDDAGVDWDYEPAPSSSYRGYIGLVLAILLVALGYMAWRQMQNTPTSQVVSAPPPAAAQPRAPETQTPSPSRPESPVVPAESKAAPAGNPVPENKPVNSAPAENSAATPDSGRPAPSLPKSDAASASAAKATPETSTAGDVAAAADKWGAEELAVAQRFLSGGNGQHRDTTEAAKWLWKSIAKHNGQATLLLADLYLKGDGVPKNCDQARVLLYSAARKGVHGAGERLRNLQAFGCQ